ncbi:hypothetical protein OQA88_12627 [Cercophora sp. LCS_1]
MPLKCHWIPQRQPPITNPAVLWIATNARSARNRNADGIVSGREEGAVGLAVVGLFDGILGKLAASNRIPHASYEELVFLVKETDQFNLRKFCDKVSAAPSDEVVKAKPKHDKFVNAFLFKKDIFETFTYIAPEYIACSSDFPFKEEQMLTFSRTTMSRLLMVLSGR